MSRTRHSTRRLIDKEHYPQAIRLVQPIPERDRKGWLRGGSIKKDLDCAIVFTAGAGGLPKFPEGSIQNYSVVKWKDATSEAGCTART